MLRITREDMELLGVGMKQIQTSIDEPTTADAEGLHINPLKLVAFLVNLWLLIRLYSSQPSSATGRVLALLSGNMSALSSMFFVGKTSNLVARSLACFATSLLVHAAAIQVSIQPNHIKGTKFNHLEDFLSCSEAGQSPLWERVIEQCSHLYITVRSASCHASCYRC
jgi:hypothetical protein